MKKLFIIRHAKSSWDNPYLDDFDRPLNQRGENDAPRIGNHLKIKGIHPDLILSSTANRALTTAKIIGQWIGYPANQIISHPKLYHASASQLKKVIKSQNNGLTTIFLFGHNPGLTDLANLLSNARIDNIPTCGVLGIQFTITSWDEIDKGGTFLDFFSPKTI
jgi:phosphohistidine phosphatase